MLTRVEATDDDSEAGVTFSLVTEESSERAGEYFSVSPGGQIILQVRSYKSWIIYYLFGHLMSLVQRFESVGNVWSYLELRVIYLQGDLTNELYEEYQLTVLASDTGSPSLSTRAKLRLVVLQVVTLPPNTGVGFEDSSHVIQVRLLDINLFSFY